MHFGQAGCYRICWHITPGRKSLGERKMTTVFTVVILVLEEKLCSVNSAGACAQRDEAAKRKGDEQGGLLAVERLLLLAGAVDGLAAQNYQHTKEK